jgi:hypothetical protein
MDSYNETALTEQKSFDLGSPSKQYVNQSANITNIMNLMNSSPEHSIISGTANINPQNISKKTRNEKID